MESTYIGGNGADRTEGIDVTDDGRVFITGRTTSTDFPLTSNAILKLEMQGKLSTGDNISVFFNNVPPDKQSITIHDLLRHQSSFLPDLKLLW